MLAWRHSIAETYEVADGAVALNRNDRDPIGGVDRFRNWITFPTAVAVPGVGWVATLTPVRDEFSVKLHDPSCWVVVLFAIVSVNCSDWPAVTGGVYEVMFAV